MLENVIEAAPMFDPFYLFSEAGNDAWAEVGYDPERIGFWELTAIVEGKDQRVRRMCRAVDRRIRSHRGWGFWTMAEAKKMIDELQAPDPEEEEAPCT